jgi:predicted permease
METFLRDLKFGIRTLLRSPGFTAIAVLTLALGIGANTAIFSVVQGVMLAPLPYDHPDQLVIAWEKNPQGRYISPSYPEFQDWQRGSHAFQSMAAFTSREYDITNIQSPDHLSGWQISSGFFRTLGVKFVLGRDFSAEEDQRGGAPAAIISAHVWKEHFSGSKDVLGKPIDLDGIAYTIVGVAPTGLNFGGPVDVYTPISQGDPLLVSDRRTHAFVAIARLQSTASLHQAEADLATIQKNLGELYPKFNQDVSAGIVPLKEALIGDVSGTLLMLLGSVGLVLLIACANVSSLVMARAVAREREFAIRSALGAKPFRILRQLLTENLLLFLTGGALGLMLANWGVKPILAAVPGQFPRADNVGLNLPVLLFAFGVSVFGGIIFGLIPALKIWNPNRQAALKKGGHGSTSTSHPAQSGLVIVQTALTLILLVGAGLLFRTIRHLWSVNPGFDAHQLISFKTSLSPDITKSPKAMRVAYQQLIGRIQGIAGVRSADLTTLVPLSGLDNGVPFWVGPEEPESMSTAPRVLTYSVGPDYFQTMGIPLLRGRVFTKADTVQTEQVGVIDSAMAEAYFPGKDPIGQTFSFFRTGSFRIIGVVGHVKHWNLGNPGPYERVQVYTSFYQLSDQWLPALHSLTTVVVRTRLDAATLVPAVKNAIYGGGSAQPVYDIQTMQQAVLSSMAAQNFPMILLGLFAGLALLLASVGSYGLLANFVQYRTQEIGIRMALGAERADVFKMVIKRGLRLSLAGIASGLLGAFIFTRVLSSFSRLLYGVTATDPLTLTAAAFLLIATALLACYIPARRATMVAPTEALRQE